MQIDPKILEAIMSGQSVPGYYSNRTQGYWQNGYGPEAGGTYVQPDDPSSWTISQPMGNNMVAEWLGDGSFRGINQDTSKDWSNGATLVKAAIMAAAGAAGAEALGAGAAPATTEAGAGGWADWATSELTGAASNPTTAAQLNAWSAGSALPYAGSAGVGGVGGGGSAGGGAVTSGQGGGAMDFDPNGITDPNFGKNASFGGTTSVGGLDGPIPANTGRSGGNGLLNLLGAAAGAYGSRDQQQTQSRDPWGPAQPALKGLLDQLQTLQQQYAQNPLSNLQKQAYGNQFGLLNAANQGASGMLAGMQANAGGQNSYSRQNKGRSLVGSNPVWNWQPGLLNMGG